ncbi:transposase [Lacticaseibacillus paracasei]|uniref:transposase n=1 Tax=Lacticaseibacillus paracasei TaxID=1597 RepID=UPI001CDAEC16|nr:transposase [Lacticaseibacillus paracasei]
MYHLGAIHHVQYTAKHKMVKNDKRDAKMIASNLANNTYHPVYVPDDEDVPVKEYIRMRKTFQKDFKRNKQALAALLLRSGFHYPGKTPWTLKYMDWIKGLTMPTLMKDVVNEYLEKINDYIDTLERCDCTIEELSHHERYAKRVQALQCLKGISTTLAMTIHIEISDFSRFPTAKTFMSYLGLTPSEHSSGAHVSKGGLTNKATH